MSRRQTPRPNNKPLPRVWLMTDPRFGDDLLPAIKRLPLRSGVIFRHYDLAAPARLALFRQVRRICRQRGHLLLLAGGEQAARRWHADGSHKLSEPKRSSRHLRSTPVHNLTELRQARRNRIDLVLISPIFATASHPNARVLGRMGFARLARLAGDAQVIALGGVTVQKAATLSRHLAYGWAAIDAFRR